MAKITDEMQANLDREFHTGLVFGFLGGVLAIILLFGGHTLYVEHKEREQAKQERIEFLDKQYREMEQRLEEHVDKTAAEKRFLTDCYDARGWVSGDGTVCLSRGANRPLFYKSDYGVTR